MSKLARINVYTCEFGCHTVTVDVDEGVTPFMISCRAKSRPDRPIEPKYLDKDGYCIGTAYSAFYPEEPPPPYILNKLAWEWYKPTESDFAKMSKREADHYRAHPHELALRERTTAPMRCHK